MYSKSLFTKTSVLLLGLWAASLGQTKKVAIGIDYGLSSIIQQNLYTYNEFNRIYVQSGALIPKNLRGHIEFNLKQNFSLRFSSGYGFTKENSIFTRSVQFDSTSAAFMSRTETKHSASGIPIEGVLVFQIREGGNLGGHFGLGGGFYSYQFRSEGLYEETGDPDTGDIKETFKEPTLKISGFAQFFVAGLDMYLGPQLKFSFEITKMGLSLLKRTQENEFIQEGTKYKIREELDEDYNSGSGLDDIAFSIGVSWYR